MTNLFPPFLPLFVVIVLVMMRRPINVLRRRGAISPETALPIDELTARDRRWVEKWQAQGIIREATPGRFYYDAAAERAKVRRRMPWLVGLIVVLVLAAIWLLYWQQPHVRPLP